MAALGAPGHIQFLLGDLKAHKNLPLHSWRSRPGNGKIMVSADCAG